MSLPPLGRLEAVDLRQAWISEAQHFTPWLARTENLELLAKTLEIDLELDSIEKRVGPYRADILCREVESERLVLIENQIETTDHRHLGQLLTYAAGLDTAVICWIARRFTDEHRAVLDWLNEITDDRFAFFAVEIELWRIGESPPAPRFSIVSQPNEWRRAVTKSASRVRADEPQGIDINRVAYWTAFEQALEERNGPVKARGRPPRSGFYSFTLASNIYLYAYRNVASEEVGVYLGLYGSPSRRIFEALAADKNSIEEAVGQELEWRTMKPESKYWIMLTLPSSNPLTEEDWPRQHEWLIDKLERFMAAFKPRVEAALAALPEEAES